MYCEILNCGETYRHEHCADCATVIAIDGDGLVDGQPCNGKTEGCDSILCDTCAQRDDGNCMLCAAETRMLAQQNHAAVDAAKVWRDDRCGCDHRNRDPHCGKCGGVRRWLRAVA